MAKGIYRRGNIYWIRYAGLDGRTVYESSGSEKFRDAEALLIQRKQSIKEGKQPEIKRIVNHTFRELSEKYFVGDILDCPKKDNIGAGSFGKQASKCVARQTEDERKKSGAAV